MLALEKIAAWLNRSLKSSGVPETLVHRGPGPGASESPHRRSHWFGLESYRGAADLEWWVAAWHQAAFNLVCGFCKKQREPGRNT